MKWDACYPGMGARESELVQKMMARRRERATLNALNELAQYLHGLREERKAILTVTEGWLLFRPDPTMTNLGSGERPPTPDPVTVGPDGRLTTKNPNTYPASSQSDCWADRQTLAMLDDDQFFRDMIGEANRANASFYTIDPRGLPVFDTAIGPDPPPPLSVDFAMLRARVDSIRTLADATDGIAVVNSNDLDGGLKRITDDLSSYYLLGYYSTNTRLDGKFRTIKVRVKRPGVDIRARRGYRAATEAEVSKAKTAAAGPVPAMAGPVAAALGTLDRVRPTIRFYVNAVPGARPGSAGISTIWVAGEVQPASGADPSPQAGSADVDVSGSGTSGSAHVTLAAGQRAFVVPVKLSKPIESGQVDVRVRMTGGDGATDRAVDSLAIAPAAGLGRPLLFRRGPGNRQQPAATFQFSRSERVRLEVPVATDLKPGTARLLDRTGQPLPIPVTVGERSDDQTGDRWLTADVTLAPLAPGDYVIELTAAGTAAEQRVLAPIRVTR